MRREAGDDQTKTTCVHFFTANVILSCFFSVGGGGEGRPGDQTGMDSHARKTIQRNKMDRAASPRAPTREDQVEDLLRRIPLSCWTSPREREDALYALRTHTCVAIVFVFFFFHTCSLILTLYCSMSFLRGPCLFSLFLCLFFPVAGPAQAGRRRDGVGARRARQERRRRSP